jgi:biopolymer transport protein ExbB
MKIDAAFQHLVGLGATWVLWVLIGLSVIALSVILERLVFFLSSKVDRGDLRVQLNRGLARKGLAQVKRALDESPSMEARIVAAAVDADSPEQADELMAAESSLQRLRAEKNLAFLGTLGNNAPFVGLLGTVIGIIGAFHQLDASGGQLTSGLMAEIGEALIATAVGLLVALPAVAAYNSFQRVINVRLARGDAWGRQLVANLHLLARDPDRQAPQSSSRRAEVG